MLKYLFILCFPISIFSQTRYLDDLFTATSKTTYSYSKTTDSLKLDFYSPKNDDLKERPLLIFVHGGGFAIGQRDDSEIIKIANAFVKKGYLVASISYRLTRQGKSFGCTTEVEEKLDAFKKAGEDLLQATCFLIDKKEEFNIDENKIIWAGSSAGAEALLMTAYNRSLFFKKNNPYNTIKPAAVISLAGAILDINISKKNAIPGIFFHGVKDPLVPYKSASHHFCDKNAPGYLIFHGSKSITNKLKELDTSYTLYTITEGKHDIFETTDKKLTVIFKFLEKVVIKKEFFQETIIQ